MTELLYDHAPCRRRRCAACNWQRTLDRALADDPLLSRLQVQEEPWCDPDEPGWLVRLRWDDGPAAKEMLSRLIAVTGGQAVTDRNGVTVTASDLTLLVSHEVSTSVWLSTFAAETVAAVYAGRFPDGTICPEVVDSAGPPAPDDPLVDVFGLLFADRAELTALPYVTHVHYGPLWDAHARYFDELPGLVDLAAVTLGRWRPAFDFVSLYARKMAQGSPPMPVWFTWKPFVETPAKASALAAMMAGLGPLPCGSGLVWEPVGSGGLSKLEEPGRWRLDDNRFDPAWVCDRTARWAVVPPAEYAIRTDNAFLCEECCTPDRWREWARFHPVQQRWCDSYFGGPYQPVGR